MILLLSVAMAGEASVSWYDAGPGRHLEVHLDVDGEVDADAIKVSVQDRNAIVEGVQRFGDTDEGAAIALLIDTVGYDSTQQAALRKAGKAFVENMSGGDTAAILGVGDTLHGLEREPVFTADPPLLYRHVEDLPFGRDDTTTLWRSCVQAIEAMDAPGLPERKAIILLSDGFDRTRTTHQDCLESAKKRQIPIFTAWYRPSRHNDFEGRELLRTVSEETGGDFVEQPPDDQLSAMMQSVQKRLRDQWVVVASTRDHDQGDLPVRIELREDLAVVQRLYFPEACCEGLPSLEEEEDGRDVRQLGIAGLALVLLGGGVWLLFGGRRKPLPPPSPTPASHDAEPSAPKTAVLASRWALEVIEGGIAGQLFAIPKAGLRLGADVSNDAVVPDGELSGFHCRLTPTMRGVELVDLNSTNGTWFEGERVEATVLSPGQRFVAGGHTFEVVEK